MANNKYTKEFLAPIVERCFTWADVCRAVGRNPLTGAVSHIKRRAVQLGIPHTHFLGKSVTLGRASMNKRDINDYLQLDGVPISSHKLKVALVREGIKKPECEICHTSVWMGDPVVLELDHINSNHYDNRLENLQIICPNCHAQKTRKVARARPRHKESVRQSKREDRIMGA